MSRHKVTPFISEIKNFFNNNDLTGAMQTIAHIFSQIRMTDQSTLGIRDKCNTLHGCLAVFQCLILLPYLGVKNIFRTKDSAVTVLMDTQKDVFYRFLRNPSVTKETVQLSVAQQIWEYLQDIVAEIAQLFGLLEEEDFEIDVNKSDELAHICEFYNLKSAC